LFDLVRAALENTAGISAEIEVFQKALSELSPDAAAERLGRTTRAWAQAL
jgi:hypothetical protein